MNDIQQLSSKTTFAAAEKELAQDIRNEAAERRARHEKGEFTSSESLYSLGFSVDSDGHWHEHGEDYNNRQREYLRHEHEEDYRSI